MARAIGVASRLPRSETIARAGAAETRWLLAAAAVMVVVCGAPYVVAETFGPPELARLGTFWFVRDFSQYQAAMREGAGQASWLIHNRFSAEPHAAVLMYPLYAALGKLAAALQVDALRVFAAAEWLGRLSLLGALYLFSRTFTREARLAVMLAAGTLGFAALLVPLRLMAQGLAPDAIDVYLEVNSFGLFFAGPHLMLGMALTLGCGVLYLRAAGGERRSLAGLAAAMVALALVHPFNLPVLLSVLVAHALWTGRTAWLAAALATAAAAPIVVYSVLLYHFDPFWTGTYVAQNLMPSPPPWALVVDFGLVLLAAPLAWPVVRTWSAERRRLLLLWVGLGLLWMYAPVPYQRRLGFGVQPGLAVLAAAGLTWLQGWLSGVSGLRRRFVNDGILVLALCTSVLVYVMLLASAANNRPAEVYLWSQAESNAAAWLGSNSAERDVVLASTEFSNPLAGAIDGRVVHGHIVATLDSNRKQALVHRFYASETSAADRSALLSEAGATVVALGPRERALGAVDLSDQPELTLAYDRDGVQLFRVSR